MTREEMKARLRKILLYHFKLWSENDIQQAEKMIDQYEVDTTVVLETHYMGQRGDLYTGKDWIEKANSGSSRVVMLGTITDEKPDQDITARADDTWARVELFRWQYGVLPSNSDNRKLDVAEGLKGMAQAIETRCKTGKGDMPTPANVVSVLRYVAELVKGSK